MTKQKKKAKGRFRSSPFRQSSNRRVVELKPEELAAYVRLAEKQVLPLIKETAMDAGAAQFLLALYTQTLVTNDSSLTTESAMTIADNVLALWQEGYYTPDPQYPYTLEETLQSLQEGPKAKADYAEWFQPFTSEKAELPYGFGEVAGGIVKHPETHLWQIWMLIDGSCEYVGAFRDATMAQRGLEELIDIARNETSLDKGLALFRKLSGEGNGKPKQIPYDMMLYLIENVQRYTILL